LPEVSGKGPFVFEMEIEMSDKTDLKPERVAYRFEVLFWDITTRMLVTPSDWKGIVKDPHFEFTDVIFMCKITSPDMGDIKLAEISIGSEPQMEAAGFNFSCRDIGVLSMTRPNLLSVRCYVPQRVIDTVLAASAAGKIHHILMFGEKLIKPRALVFDLMMSTRPEHAISFA
jgi:hypothetical protein